MAKAGAKPEASDTPDDGDDVFSKRRILAFSPDEASIPAAQKVLKKGGFGKVEATADGTGWWVVCRGLTDVYQTSVRVEDEAFTGDCTCPSPKYPCKHVLALLLYLHDHPEERAEPEAPKHAATDFEALLRAVFQNPEDDTPRLVFADFLEENDQPDRAALIRVQCALAREKAKSPRAKELSRAEFSALAKVSPQVGTLPEGMRAQFRRGFLDLSMNLYLLRDIGSLPERFTRLFRDGWVETVRVLDYYYDHLDEGHSPLLSLVAELDFTGRPMGDDGLISVVAQTAEMRATGRLCRVNVAKQNQKAFEALLAAQAGEATGGHTGRVDEVRNHRRLTRQSLDLLIRAGRLQAARQLHLTGQLGDWGAERLAEADLGPVERLRLENWGIGPEGITALGNSMGLPALTELYLSESQIGPEHVAALARGPAFARLERLTLGMVDLRDAALAELARATQFRSLRHLGLGDNRLTLPAVGDFLKSRNFPSLQSISLGDDPTDYRALIPLILSAADRTELTVSAGGLTLQRWCSASGVRLGVATAGGPGEDLIFNLPAGSARRVTSLRVTQIDVTQKDMKSLAKALDPATFRELELRDIRLRNEGVGELVAAFKGFAPVTLRLPFCRVQASGVAALAESPLLDSVKVLDLTGNTIGKAGAAALAKSPHLGNLEKLELTPTKVGTGERQVLTAKFGKKLSL